MIIREGCYIDHVVVAEMQRDAYHLGELAALDPGVRIIADVGANIGAFAVLAHKFFPEATIDAYEPEPSNFDLLASNAPLGVTSLHNVAVWSDHGGTTVSANAGLTTTGAGDVEVATITLDDVIGDGLDLLKIDTEGAEHVFIPPCTRLGRVKWLAMEYHNYSDAGPMTDVLGKLAETHALTYTDGFHDRGGVLTGRLR